MADVTKYNSEAKVFWQKTEELLNELQELQRDTQSIDCPCSNPDCPFNSKNTRSDSKLYHSAADQQFLTSSLPATSEDFKKRRSLRSRREGSLDDDRLKVPVFSKRPRSASLHVSNIRRSLRGLSRARPSSARPGRAKLQLHGGVLRREVSTQEVDSAFAKIKQQLAQFSEEDQVLKDRLDKLIEEINDLKLRNSHKAKRLRYKRSSSEQPNSPECLEQRGKIVMSTSEANLAPLNSKLKHQSEMELHTNCGSKSQIIILRVSEPA